MALKLLYKLLEVVVIRKMCILITLEIEVLESLTNDLSRQTMSYTMVSVQW